VKYRLDPNFIEFVPVKNEFRDKRSLPQSIADLSLNDEMVNFYPVTRKGQNFLKYCGGWLYDNEKPSSIVQCVRQYTSDPNWFCSEINMALAADSPELSRYGRYIRQLKYSIGMSRMNFTGTVFRGVDMSPSEVAKYEQENLFFIPSFTSTSTTKPFGGKNALIHIDITPEWSKFCMEIQPKHTDFPHEDEILLSCYNLYKHRRTERSNGQRIIKLELMNYHRYFDYRRNEIRYDNSFDDDDDDYDFRW